MRTSRRSPFKALQKESEAIWNERIKALEDEVRCVSAELQDSKKQSETTEQLLQESEERVEELVHELQLKEEEYKHQGYMTELLKEEMAQLRQETKDSEQQSSSRAQAVDKLTKINRSLEEELQRERNRTSDYMTLMRENTSLKDANSLSTSQNQELMKDLMKKTEECSVLQKQIEELQKEIEEKKKIADATKSGQIEIHKLLTENMTEYKKSLARYKDDMQKIQQKLKKKEDSSKALEQLATQWSRLVNKMKILRVSKPNIETKLDLIDQAKDDYYTASQIVDEIRVQLEEKQKVIEKLQNMSAELIPRREDWINSIQIPLKQIIKILQQKELEHYTNKILQQEFDEIPCLKWKLNKPKVEAQEITEIIQFSLELIEKLKEESKKKSDEIVAMNVQLKKFKESKKITKAENESTLKMESQIRALESEVASKKAELSRYKFLSEAQLQQQKELFDKSREDLSREASKLDACRQEGILLGQRQQRSYRDEELAILNKKIADLQKACTSLENSLQSSLQEKSELEKYNHKANSEISLLISALKEEQEKQRQLSQDLEMLTMELSKRKLLNSRY